MELYISNLEENATDTLLHQLFTPFGRVRSTCLGTDPATNHCQGFGFVEMADKDALLAIRRLHGFLLGSHHINVRQARKSGQLPFCVAISFAGINALYEIRRQAGGHWQALRISTDHDWIHYFPAHLLLGATADGGGNNYQHPIAAAISKELQAAMPLLHG